MIVFCSVTINSNDTYIISSHKVIWQREHNYFAFLIMRLQVFQNSLVYMVEVVRPVWNGQMCDLTSFLKKSLLRVKLVPPQGYSDQKGIKLCLTEIWQESICSSLRTLAFCGFTWFQFLIMKILQILVWPSFLTLRISSRLVIWKHFRDFPGGPVARTSPSKQAVWVPSLVGELRSYIPWGQKNQNIKQKQYCNKFNQDFKNGPHQKKKKQSFF